MAQFYTLEEAARVLGMGPEDLKQKAQHREVRAFMDSGSWQFRVADIDELARRRGLGSDPELMLSDHAQPVSDASGSDEIDLSEFQLGTAKADLASRTADLTTGQSGSDDDQDVQFDDLSLPPGPLSNSSSTIIGMKSGGKLPTDSDVRLVPDQPVKGTSDSDVRLMPASLEHVASDSDVTLVNDDASLMDINALKGSGSGSGSNDSPVAGRVGSSAEVFTSDVESSSDFELMPSQDIASALQPETGSDFELTALDASDEFEATPMAGPSDSDVTAAQPSASGINLARPSDSGINLQGVGGFDLSQADSIELAPLDDETEPARPAPKSVEAGRMLADVPLADWKTYARWQIVDTEAGRLSKPFDREHFAFYGTTLSGTKEQQPRWKRALGATDGAVGEALGQLYVAQAFPPAAKARALALVQNLKGVLRDDLTQLPWMGPDTRRQALVKVDAMAIKIGYPDKWRDYSKLDVSSPSYVVNAMRADEFEFQRDLNKIGKPVDKQEWGMTPPTPDAYYDPQNNTINFPAGILQPPFFNADADDAVNYGAIGAVIGHEMTHGFDDQGRQYDAQGNLRDWWTADDLKNFTQRAQGIISQYSAYEPLPGQHINGALTTGENIADIGGLKIAYLALEKSLSGKPRTRINGFTPEQRFFLSFAQMWHDKRQPAYAKVALATDPHSPDQYRVIGALADTPEFRQAFGCPPDPKASSTTLW